MASLVDGTEGAAALTVVEEAQTAVLEIGTAGVGKLEVPEDESKVTGSLLAFPSTWILIPFLAGDERRRRSEGCRLRKLLLLVCFSLPSKADAQRQDPHERVF